MDMLCPRCRVPMVIYERMDASIAECHVCRGLFFDRGGLERLIVDRLTAMTADRHIPLQEPRGEATDGE